MNNFENAKLVEQESWRILGPFIQRKSYNGQCVVINKGRLARELQATAGDVIMNTSSKSFSTLELKSEATSPYGNLYLESWSNRSRWRLGWFFTIQSDLLLYHIVDEWVLYVFKLDALREWAFSKDGPTWRIARYPEKQQRKRAQKNDTWGFCVPVKHLLREVAASKSIDLTAVCDEMTIAGHTQEEASTREFGGLPESRPAFLS